MPIIEALQSKHAMDIDFFDLRGVSGFADAFIIATARSQVNAQALNDAVTDALDVMGLPYKAEGEPGTKWRLIDAGYVVIHLFSREGREFYKLERLWGDSPSKRFESEE
ncbi:MAG: ribosome silencing factor [Synergistaceae bacterium]|nr:ribosome silencing factor [Synergistaceae bacterium]